MKTIRTAFIRWGLAAAAFLGCASGAHATATLQARIVDTDCTLTTSGGATSVVPCSASGWAVTLQPGWSAQMVSIIDYRYHDDGLALLQPAGFQMDANGFSVRRVDHEAGALYAFTSHCTSRYCQHPPGQETTGWSGFPPVFLSDNDVPDDLSGTLTVTTGALLNSSMQPFTWTPNVFIGLQSFTYSGPVAPVPEPSTWASMLFSLALVATALRQRRSAVSR